MSTLNPTRRWDPWPVSIITFFAVAIIGLGSFVVFCSRHPADLVAADYYEQEIRYQGQMDSRQRAQEAGQPAAVSYDAAAGQITLSLPPRFARDLAQGKIQLYRPSAANQDRQIKLAPDGNGVQVIDASGLEPGLWKVRVSWTANQKDYYLDQKVVVGTRTS
jgi:nitrogen fixation protein FixH